MYWLGENPGADELLILMPEKYYETAANLGDTGTWFTCA